MDIRAPTVTSSSAIEGLYRRRSPRSAELHARAARALPGGNSRQVSYWRPYPLFVDRAAGTRLWDVDGNQYLDLLNNYSAMVHGHAYPPVLDAVDIARGTGWAANNTAMVELAELLVKRVPSVEQIRFTNSGTEAGLLALLVARLVTGRHKVLMSRFGYHGSLHEFESGTLGHPGPATLMADYNHLASFEEVLDAQGDDVAAVFLEPLLGAGGVVAADPEFLAGVKRATQRAGSLFVLDEVITFRLGVGGLQGELGIEPDLTMFGKLIGGGFPVGAVGGREELMATLDPAAMKAFHSGTYNANPVTMTAGAVSVEELTSERIEEMHCLAERLEKGLREAAKEIGFPLSVRRAGSLLALSFSQEPVPLGARREDEAVLASFHLAALNRGLMLAPRGLMALSTVMDAATVDETVERAAAAMSDVAAEAEVP